MDESPSERRSDHLSREVFDRAVAAAATQATQNVAQIHRRRLVRQTASVTLLLSLVVGLVLTLVFRAEARHVNRENALHNCRLIKDVSRDLADFVASDASLRVKQAKLNSSGRIGLTFAHLLGARTFARALAQSNALNASVTRRWTSVDVPRLKAIAQRDCQRRLK